MVAIYAPVFSVASLLLGAENSVEPVLERLDPPRRAAVIMALLALTLIGLFFIVFAMIGGHWVRRIARQRPTKKVVADPGSTADAQRLRQSLTTFLPEAKSDDTIQLGRSPKDTRVGN